MIGLGMVTFVTCRTSTLTALYTNTYVIRGMMKRSAQQPANLSSSWMDGCLHALVIQRRTPKEDFRLHIKTRLSFGGYQQSQKTYLHIHHVQHLTVGCARNLSKRSAKLRIYRFGGQTIREVMVGFLSLTVSVNFSRDSGENLSQKNHLCSITATMGIPWMRTRRELLSVLEESLRLVLSSILAQPQSTRISIQYGPDGLPRRTLSRGFVSLTKNTCGMVTALTISSAEFHGARCFHSHTEGNMFPTTWRLPSLSALYSVWSASRLRGTSLLTGKDASIG